MLFAYVYKVHLHTGRKKLYYHPYWKYCNTRPQQVALLLVQISVNKVSGLLRLVEWPDIGLRGSPNVGPSFACFPFRYIFIIFKRVY